MKKIVKNEWFISIIVNVIILIIILLCTNMIYETNDDYAISKRIADGYPYVGFVNYYLCRGLIVAQKIFPKVNCFIIFLLIVSFYAFVCITKTIFDSTKNISDRLMTVVVVFVFSFDHYCSIQFTKTAALLMVTGLLVMVDSILKRKKIGSYINAVLIVYIGACIRIDALLGAIAFAGSFFLLWLYNNKEVARQYFTKERILTYIALVVIVAGAFGLDYISCGKNISTEELKKAEDYSVYRSNIVDYPTYKYYRDNKEEYDKIGISENDIFLISKWYFDYDGAASLENLKQIDGIDRTNDSKQIILLKSAKKCARQIMNSVLEFSSTGVHIALLLLLAVWIILNKGFKRHGVFIVLIGIITLSLYLALYYMQRPTYRGLYVADIGAAMWLLYYNALHFSSNIDSTKIKKLSNIGLIIMVFLLMIPTYYNNNLKYEEAKGKVMSQQMMQYFEENKDKMYVWATKEKKYSSNYLTPYIAPDDSDINVTGTGGWGVLSPYMNQILSRYDISNPISNIINNDTVYYIGNKYIKRLEKYYNKWYAETGEKIKFNKIGIVDNNVIWQVIKLNSIDFVEKYNDF